MVPSYSYSESFVSNIFFYKCCDHTITGGAPYDGRARNRTSTAHYALTSIYSIAAIAGIIYAVICLVFNTVFRNKRYFLNSRLATIAIRH